MEISLNLSKHCIETEAKSQYEEGIRLYFKKRGINDDISVLEKKIEGLKYFLERADFSYLRTTYPFLKGKNASKIYLHVSDNVDHIQIKYNDSFIDIS